MQDIPIGILFAALGGLFLLSAFFSGSETALMALNRYKLRHMAEQGHRGAQRAQALLDQPDRLIGLILLGNNFVNILITQLATLIALRLYGDAGLAIATAVLTLLLLIFAEVAPKTLAALHAERVAYPAAWIYTPLLKIAYPLVWLVNLLANGLLRLLGVPVEARGDATLSREELRTVLNEANSLIPREHQKMLLGILDLERITVEDIMVPRNEIVGIDLEDDWDDIIDQLANTSYTRLPVYRGSIDQVLGFVHVRNILKLLLRKKLTQETFHESLRPVYFIPEGTSLNQQLLNFKRERHRIGLVVDEYGEILGLVTLEDLLEEIVGEFTTDPSGYSRHITPQEDGGWLVDGSTHIREINRVLGWDLPTDGPRTLNGLILEHLEMIPSPGTSVLIAGHPMEVVKVKDNAIRRVKVYPRLEQKQADEEHEP